MRSIEALRRLSLWGRWLLAVLFSTALAGAASAETTQDSPLWKQFVREAPQAWKRHQGEWRTAEFSSRVEERQRIDGKSTTTRQLSLGKQSGDLLLQQSEVVRPQTYSGYVRGENSRYVFELTRKAESKPWVIVSLKEIDKPSRKDSETAAGALIMSIPMGCVTLPKMLQSKDFTLMDVSPEPGSKSEELVRVTFEYAPPDKEVYPPGSVAVVVLDPSRNWLPSRAEIKVELGKGRKGTWKSVLRNDYKTDSNGRPYLSKSELTKTFVENGRVAHETRTVAEIAQTQRESIPESEFTLSAYGLPEPHWTQPKKTPWYLWFAVAGIVCLVLGTLVAWWKRRAARPA